jgi:hypothetical protein
MTQTRPFHREADYSVIADLYEFLPVLVRRLREGMGKSVRMIANVLVITINYRRCVNYQR